MKEVPIWEKSNLSLEEAAAYSGIGVNKLRELTNERNCRFVLWVGNKRLIKRRLFDQYIVVFQIKRAANLQIILAPYKIDVVLQPHYPETLLHITRTKILPCKLIAQEYSVSSYENGSSSSSIWQA